MQITIESKKYKQMTNKSRICNELLLKGKEPEFVKLKSNSANGTEIFAIAAF